MCKNAFGRERKCVENIQAKSRTPESLLFFGLEVPRAFYSPGTDYKVATLQGPPPANFLRWIWSWKPWKNIDFQFLKRYVTWKSNSRIKSYGSWKLPVHQSMHYPGFRDILIVLTPILIHEVLELEFDSLRNGVGSNLLWRSDQN